jgi:predicted PurR-regulated permease PerM
MNQESILNISWATIFKICLAVISLYVLYLIRDIFVWFIFAFVVSILFNFLIDFFEKKRIPRVITAIFLYFIVFFLLGFFIYRTAPMFLSEVEEFSQNVPGYFQQISPVLEKFGIEIAEDTKSFTSNLEIILSKTGQNIFNALFAIFGGVFSTMFIISLAFFISLEKGLLEKILITFSSIKHHKYLHRLIERSKKKVGAWFISRVIGMFFVGLLTYFVLRIFNVNYAFVLSLLVAIFDFVPMIGPILGGLIVVSIVTLTSSLQALFVLIAFVIIQILEANLLLPLLFRKFIGIPPSLVLISLVVGGKLWGILGAILIIPLVGIIFEVLSDYLEKSKRIEEKEQEEVTIL